MDFIAFLNSKDIAEYLRQIDYKFSPEEAMFVIHEGRNIPLAEKHAAYEELIKLYPDYKLKERREEVFKNQTLASFLQAYMQKENRLIEECKRDGDDAIYFAAYFSKEDDCWNDSSLYDIVYHSFKECFEGTLKEDEYGDIVKMTIRKKYIQTNCMIELELLPDGTVLKVEGDSSPERDEQILNAFEWMWVKIPTPFKKGDIVIPCKERVWDWQRHEEGEKAFVLTDLCTWGSKKLAENGYKNAKTHNNDEKDFASVDKLIKRHEESGDISDMIAVGYFVNDGGTIYHDHTLGSEIYLDYEYYRGELTGKYRILKAVSNYFKGEIGLDILMQAYQTILLEEKLEEMRKHHLIVYYDDHLIKAGLKNEDNK